MEVYRRGHNFETVGASNIISEVVECDKIRKELSLLYDKYDIPSIDATPGNMSQSADLKHGVDIANKNNADLFYSIHMNSFLGQNAEPTHNKMGTEIIVYNDEHLPQALNILDEFGALGFKLRGVKTLDMLDGKKDGVIEKHLYELEKTVCNAMIIECLFVDSIEDVNLYKKLGAKRIAQAIFKGLTGIDDVEKDVETKKYYRVIISSCDSKENAKKALEEYHKLTGKNGMIKYV